MKKILLITIVTLLSGCAVPYEKVVVTPYDNGLKNKKIGNNMYLVKFDGNGHNELYQVERYVKKKAAEICAPNDFDIKISKHYSKHLNSDIINGVWMETSHSFPHAEGIVTCK